MHLPGNRQKFRGMCNGSLGKPECCLQELPPQRRKMERTALSGTASTPQRKDNGSQVRGSMSMTMY